MSASFCRFIRFCWPGLVTEIEHLWGMLKAGFRHRDFGQRAVAG